MAWPSELTAQLAGSYGIYNPTGMGGGFGPQGMGMVSDSVMGSAMSRAGAMGGPLLQGAAAIAGFDPMSMGIRASMGAWRGGAGLMGAGMAGMGAMGATAGVGAVAGFVGNQMFQGAQNQMSFNGAMRQNFSFMNGMGGQGFSRQDLTGISGTLQSMTHEYGPGGEVNTFGELSRLAGNMGKMGLTTGVRDAQEFSKKFKEMVSTLKTVATELGTSLEAAQEMLSSARGSGIFKTADQLKFSGALRNTGLAGGLATSELTAMGNIGSQIARSVGGLGRQGAMGGIKALGQIGTAQQVGALSEEDVYNATGLTGAEGRQAMATQMMQNSGNFMRSSKGRWFLASIAGKNGSLDMDAVNQYMMGGGMDVGATRDRAHQNLAGVGRANFIRNEGRLRSAAMEQFGGLAPALALSGWAHGKGININDMDDRSMLFAQRQLGMGRDELDATIKIAQNLPQIMQEQRKVAYDDNFMQSRGQHMKSRDIRTRMDQFKEKIQGSIQKWGADLYQSGSSFVDGMMNRILDGYEQRISQDVYDVAYKGRLGGTSASQQFQDLVGTRQSLGAGRAAFQKAGIGSGLLSGGFSAGNQGAQQEYRRLSEMSSAAQFGKVDGAFTDFATANKGMLNEAYGMGIAGKQGDERISAIGQLLERKAKAGDPTAQSLLVKFNSGSATDKAAIVGSMERSAGISGDARLSFGKGDYFGGGGGFRSVAEANRALGQGYTGQTDIDALSGAGAGRQLAVGAASVGALVASGARGVWGLLTGEGKKGLEAGETLRQRLTDSALNSLIGGSAGGKMAEAIGATFQGKEGRQMLVDMMEKGDSSGAFQKMQALQGAGYAKLSDTDKGTLAALQMSHLGAEYSRLKASGKMTPEEQQKLLDQANSSDAIKGALGGDASVGNLEKFAQMNEAALYMSRRDNAKAIADKWGKQGVDAMSSMQQAGMLESVQQGRGGRELMLSGKTLGQLKGVANGSQAAELALQLTKDQAGLVNISDEDQRAEALTGIQAGQGQLSMMLGKMSVADKRKFAKAMAGTQAGDMALDVMGMQQRIEGLGKATRGNVGATAARFLGLNLGKEREGLLQGKSDDEIAMFLGQQTGMGGDKAFNSQLKEALGAARGGKAEAGLLMQRVMESLSPEAQKKIKEQAEGERDPLQQDIVDNTKAMKDSLELIAKTLGRSESHLMDIANKDNPEKTG